MKNLKWNVENGGGGGGGFNLGSLLFTTIISLLNMNYIYRTRNSELNTYSSTGQTLNETKTNLMVHVFRNSKLYCIFSGK